MLCGPGFWFPVWEGVEEAVGENGCRCSFSDVVSTTRRRLLLRRGFPELTSLTVSPNSWLNHPRCLPCALRVTSPKTRMSWEWTLPHSGDSIPRQSSESLLMPIFPFNLKLPLSRPLLLGTKEGGLIASKLTHFFRRQCHQFLTCFSCQRSR